MVALTRQEAAPELKYRAFLSYSHSDLAAAKRLHRTLENFVIPAKLVGTQTARGLVPERLAPIFRDIDELPATEDLSAEIKTALAQSDALIVLCTPNARSSQWVNREIELFRALHGTTRPILAALLSDEPEEAFPPALTAGDTEPVAADFRKSREGQRLALMKLVAGLTGASLDTLVQREAQRRIRRVMVVTGVALAAVLLLSVSLVAALRARSEAVRQRAEAEGLVEYMLTDLRDRLEGVGRLDVMTAVNQRAMAYYGDQASLSGLPPDSLERRARILHAMGEDDERRGDMNGAIGKFREAHRTTAAVLKQRPDNANALFAHGQSEFWVGYAADRSGDRLTTERHWMGYLDAAQALAKAEPDTKRSLMELGYAHGNVCAMFQTDPARRAAGMVHCRKSIAFEEQALAKAPQDREILTALANRHGWIANVDMRSGRFDAALEARKDEAALLARLLALDPENADYAIRASWNQMGVAAAYAASGRNAEAARLADETSAKLQSLVRKTGPQSHILELLVRSHAAHVRFLKRAGDPGWTAAMKEAKLALAALEQADGDGRATAKYRASLLSLETGGVK